MVKKFALICVLMLAACEPHKEVEFFDRRPAQFKSAATVAVCFIETPQGFLYVKNNGKAKIGAHQWTLLSDEIDPAGSPRTHLHTKLSAAGVSLEPLALKPLVTLYIKNSQKEYTYHLFYARLDAVPKAFKGYEDMKTIAFDKAQDLDLAPGVLELMGHYERYSRSFAD